MEIRQRVRSLSWALMQAQEMDLAGVPSPLANELMRHEDARPIERRPRAEECAVVLFAQRWSAQQLGFAARGAEPVEAETIVVTGPCGDACVYLSTRLLYRIAAPNRRFHLDLAAHRLRGRDERHLYETRDAADLEAFDHEAARSLQQICSAATRHSEDAARLARLLKTCAAELEQAGVLGVGLH
jgi:hypothetical protein